MLINVTLWPGECIYNQRETTLICYKIFVFVVINSRYFGCSSNEERNKFERVWQTISSSEEKINGYHLSIETDL